MLKQIFIAFIIIFIISPIIAYSTDKWVEDIIVKTERVNYENDSKYLIFGEKEVYENTDSLWYWKWNSSDFYKDLKVGQKYQLRVYGFRFGFFSWYKNII